MGESTRARERESEREGESESESESEIAESESERLIRPFIMSHWHITRLERFCHRFLLHNVSCGKGLGSLAVTRTLTHIL